MIVNSLIGSTLLIYSILVLDTDYMPSNYQLTMAYGSFWNHGLRHDPQGPIIFKSVI